MRIDEIKALPKYGTKFPAPKSVGSPADYANDDDIAAMRWYTGHGYSPINAELRGVEPDFERGSDEEMIDDYGVAMSNAEGIERIDRLLASAPKRRGKVRVFRGESKVAVTNRLLAMEPGQSFTDPAYLSTTFDPSYAFYAFAQSKLRGDTGSAAISMYEVPNTVAGAFMHFDGESVEKEFVLARGCTYTLREKRSIPVRNRGYPVREITLLIWDVSPPLREDVQWSKRVLGDDVIVWVDAEKVRASWAKDRHFYFDNDAHPNAIKGRIPRFNDWLKLGQPVNPPEVTLNDEGDIIFVNGRHRFVWMLQNGETRVPVAVPPESAKEVARRFGV